MHTVTGDELVPVHQEKDGCGPEATQHTVAAFLQP